MYFFKISCVFKQLCIFCSIGNMRAACVGSPRLLLPAGTCAFPRRRLHRLRPAPARTANNTGSLPKHADGLPRLFTIKGNPAPRRQCPRTQNTPEKRRRKGNGSANREERPGGEKNAALPGTGADDAEEGDMEREREREKGGKSPAAVSRPARRLRVRESPPLDGPRFRALFPPALFLRRKESLFVIQRPALP